MKILYTDVLVIGGGLAGLRVAIGAKAPRPLRDDPLVGAAQALAFKAAQGGMQASLGNVIKGQGDNEDVHFEDTVRGSDWGADQDVVRMFVNTAPKAVRELAAWGVPWSRVRKGDREVVINGQRVTITERDEAHGLVAQRDFGGTKKWRTCYVSDCTGHAMLQAVGDQAIAASIPVHERTEALALIHDAGRCYGAVVRDLITGELCAYVAKATVIATGGAGRLYRVTTNAVICEGIGHAIALETGVAALGNMEAVQFHPTGIFPAGILVTEGCRGDGGLLKDGEGHRFMPDYEPEKKELASRDVVSRRMEEHIAKGKAAKSRFGDHLWLDITLLGEKHIKNNLREVFEICHYFLGVDPTRDMIPVRPAQHYTMGGVRTRYTGESPSLKGLFAAGEASCWDMHGFNRLGGNSVAETVVAGMIVGEFVADFCDRIDNDVDIPTGAVRGFLEREQASLSGILLSRGSESAPTLRARMQEIMTAKVGIFRRGEDLASAVEELQQLLVRSRDIGLRGSAAGNNPELVIAYRTRKMLKLALTVAYGALTRTESRGAHFRQDFPRRDDSQWLKRTLATWRSESDTLPTLGYEPLDVARMELPPGWRGYGAKDYIDHPDTPARQAEVDAVKERVADRFERQRLLMPYEDLLPETLRGRNERIDEKVLRMNDLDAAQSPRNGEKIRLHVLRYNPQQPGDAPRMQTYEIEQSHGMTLFIALNEIRETLDPSLQFDFVCRAGICGSCGMMVNGRPTLACRTLTKDVGPDITLAPLPVFELIGDLSVDTGKWMRGMSERLEAWLHAKNEDVDRSRIEEPMDPDLAEKLNELDRCVECGCCVASCGTARMRSDFVGAVGIAKIARFRLDPRDKRDDAAYYELIGDDSGVFGCMSLLACHDVCPKNLPLQTQIAFVRRKMMREGL